ncbi:hypothetical protein [Microbulbifer sp. THAF38]|uniref:hypothetical protein n=1 Tax=Microbulbifer sp. THAF38 TaxID=2587856 RepID=UPI0012679964|nr:hypothetical protein [Microbulbifer sp. THAF38]QFT55575.1 hypothetical protein FIU95_13555 [Microbulbifer sp. THAF38]
MSYRTGPGVPRTLTDLWQFVRREFMSIERLYTRVETQAKEASDDLSVIADDGYLHQSEKLLVVLRYAQITGEKAGLEQQADSYDITTEKTAYSESIANLTTYLDALVPAWTDTTAATKIVREEWDDHWQAVTTAKTALQNKIDTVAGQRAVWSGVADDGKRPEDGATVGATPQEREQIRSMRNTFLETFENPDWMNAWTHYYGGGEIAVGGGETILGGRSVLLGNDSDDDTVGIHHKDKIPFDPSKLYRVEMRLYKYADTDPDRPIYLGIVGFDKNGVYCNTFGSESLSSQHYVVASGQNVASEWVSYVGYFKGNAPGDAVIGGAIGGNHIGNPAQLQASVRYFSPLALVNYGGTGRTLIDYIKVDVVEVQDQRSLPMIQASVASLPTSSALSASDDGNTAKITIAAHTVQFGFGPVNYNSGSISGLSFSTRYYVYCDDPGIKGGAVTYYATKNFPTSAAGTWRRSVGTINTPANGGDSTAPDNPWCVAAGTWLRDDLQVDDCKPGDLIRCWDVGDSGTHLAPIQAVEAQENVPCVLLTMSSGAQVICSRQTPVTDRAGRVYWAQDCHGVELGTCHHGEPFSWEKVVSVECAGLRTVYKISVGGISYASGVDPLHLVVTHNIQHKP